MRRNAPRVAAALGCGIFAISGFASSASGHSETGPISQEEIDEALSTPTELTFWTWVPDIQNEVDLFEEAYPAISVTVENVGQGAPTTSSCAPSCSRARVLRTSPRWSSSSSHRLS